MAAFVLRLQGRMCVHAAVSVVDDEAVVLAGRPGTGKSTLAAGLSLRGCALVTDDVAALVPDARGFAVHPGPAVLRPRRTSLEALGEAAASRVLASSPGLDWVEFDPAASLPPGAGPVHIRSIYLLEPRTADMNGVKIERLDPSDAVVQLARDNWASRLQDRDMRQLEFETLGRLVDTTPVARLAYNPADPGWIAAACERLAR